MVKKITGRELGSKGEIECLEDVYGMSLEEIEAEWVAWGKRIDKG
ncbi:MAG: hypothetical protein ABIK28_14190 [Planctomycetota bacterium]